MILEALGTAVVWAGMAASSRRARPGMAARVVTPPMPAVPAQARTGRRMCRWGCGETEEWCCCDE